MEKNKITFVSIISLPRFKKLLIYIFTENIIKYQNSQYSFKLETIQFYVKVTLDFELVMQISSFP
jgi:hypothetical protein